jgi:DNA-binding CsgD family transcriptional regulator
MLGIVFRRSTGFYTDFYPPYRFYVRRMIRRGAWEGGSVRRLRDDKPVSIGSSLSRIVVRPYAVAESPWEAIVAGVGIALLILVFVIEVLTPEVVVSALALLPLLAAVWMLSNRLAGLVALLATLLIAAAAAVEEPNRMTVVLIGVTLLATASLVRVYATSLASLLSSRRHLRPTIPTRATPATLDGMDEASHGLRSLTRRELDVARLAAEGYTGPEISRRLRIGVRTVESHLASTYSKLRISSRPQLIRMASRLGATGHEAARIS